MIYYFIIVINSETSVFCSGRDENVNKKRLKTTRRYQSQGAVVDKRTSKYQPEWVVVYNRCKASITPPPTNMKVQFHL